MRLNAWNRPLVKTQCTGSSGSRQKRRRPIGFSVQMHSSIGQFQNCQPVLTLRAKPVSFLQNRNVEQVNRTSGASRGGGGFLAGTCTSENRHRSAPFSTERSS